MTYLEWIKKNHLWSKWTSYRLNHLKVSKNRALRAFCLKYGCPFAKSRRIDQKRLEEVIAVAKVNLYELY